MKTETPISYYELDEFTKAYIKAALGSSTDDEGNPLDDGRDGSDLPEETLRKMAEDCANFQKVYGIPEYNDPIYSDAAKAGHDFWLTRNGHGAGFWDRGLGDIGDHYTEFAKSYGCVDLYVGDDGLIYQA